MTNPTQSKGAEQIFPPWQIDHWRAVDDRVRGGSSVSHLGAAGGAAVEAGHGHKGKKGDKGARFWGNLDTKTLGGAGFASQSYRYGPAPLRLPRLKYSGLRVVYRPDSKTIYDVHTPVSFTLVLKTTPTAHIPREPKVPPQPRESQLTYEATFALPKSTLTSTSDTASGKAYTSEFGWSEFQATYRGRPVHEGEERWVPLEPGAIYEVSFMCRSDFGKQQGEFGVIINSLQAVPKDEKRRSLTAWITGWVGGIVQWFKGMMGWGRIKLDDEESALDEKRALIG